MILAAGAHQPAARARYCWRQVPSPCCCRAQRLLTTLVCAPEHIVTMQPVVGIQPLSLRIRDGGIRSRRIAIARDQARRDQGSLQLQLDAAPGAANSNIQPTTCVFLLHSETHLPGDFTPGLKSIQIQVSTDWSTRVVLVQEQPYRVTPRRRSLVRTSTVHYDLPGFANIHFKVGPARSREKLCDLFLSSDTISNSLNFRSYRQYPIEAQAALYQKQGHEGV